MDSVSGKVGPRTTPPIGCTPYHANFSERQVFLVAVKILSEIPGRPSLRKSQVSYFLLAPGILQRTSSNKKVCMNSPPTAPSALNTTS